MLRWAAMRQGRKERGVAAHGEATEGGKDEGCDGRRCCGRSRTRIERRSVDEIGGTIAMHRNRQMMIDGRKRKQEVKQEGEAEEDDDGVLWHSRARVRGSGWPPLPVPDGWLPS